MEEELDHLQREGFSKALAAMFVPMLDKTYQNPEDFLEAFPIFLGPKQRDIIFRYASTEQIKIQADEFSTDFNENAAVFRGNVKGFIPRENIDLTTAKLRLVSGTDSNFEKLIGEGGVFSFDDTLYNICCNLVSLLSSTWFCPAY